MVSEKKAVLIDALLSDEKNLKPSVDIICKMLEQDGYEVLIFKLCELKLNHCIGCFGCWIKTPGKCIFHDDSQKILKAMMQSDYLIFVSTISFGGFSSDIKIIIDRLIPNILPHFNYYHDEIHHVPRYLQYPKLIVLGIQDYSDKNEINNFKLLVGRNAINFKSPNYSVDVISKKDSLNTIRNQLQSLLKRNDKWPLKDDILPVMSLTMPEKSDANLINNKKALLLIGSPKIKKTSTSSVLGNIFLDRLKKNGWSTDSLTLKKDLLDEKGQSALFSKINKADFIILAFPLYIDSLPFLVTKALELIFEHRDELQNLNKKQIFPIINCGFPESYQNALALSICHNFAVKCGISWNGALAMGAGEALCSGEPIDKGSSFSRPPGNHIIKALNLAADSIASTNPVPKNAQAIISKSPIPFLPFNLWRWFFIKLGNMFWQKQSNENGVSNQEMLKRHYDL